MHEKPSTIRRLSSKTSKYTKNRMFTQKHKMILIEALQIVE